MSHELVERYTATAAHIGADAAALTLSQLASIADTLHHSPGEIAVAEAMVREGIAREEVISRVLASFEHNLKALDIGMAEGHSFLLGRIDRSMIPSNALCCDDFLNRAIVYALAAQVGNHTIGLEPCAGTGDSCTYAGLMRAMLDTIDDHESIALAAAIMLKIGVTFRVGKVTTGCNMEGLGAGAAATAGTLVQLRGGTGAQLERAIVLALSPTIANPCTPRVMVAGLCAAHLGGGILLGSLGAGLAMSTEIPIDVPVDVMVSMAGAAHVASARAVVPEVVRYLQPFFRTNPKIDRLVGTDALATEAESVRSVMAEATGVAETYARTSNPITRPFGQAVVGGSSQAVGSPTNAARIAHALVEGEARRVEIQLYPELFARRGINVPGILMGAIWGTPTTDAKSYASVVDEAERLGIEVEVRCVDEPGAQCITIFTDKGTSQVYAQNRGGARLAIRSAIPSRDLALEAARRLGIEVVD